MKVLVAIKRVVDYSVHVRIRADGSGVETDNVKMSMNPFDEIALEEAIRLKEQGRATEVIAVSIGNTACQETLRSALAMGADRAILVETAHYLEPLAIAKILTALVIQENISLCLLGKQAIDSDDNMVGQMLAGLLDWPQAMFASKIEFTTENRVRVTREVDKGLTTLDLTLPAVISADLRLNQPRYLSLPNIMKARSKPLAVVPLTTLSIDTTPRTTLIKVSAPDKRRTGMRVATAAELVNKLRAAGVLP